MSNVIIQGAKARPTPLLSPMGVGKVSCSGIHFSKIEL